MTLMLGCLALNRNNALLTHLASKQTEALGNSRILLGGIRSHLVIPYTGEIEIGRDYSLFINRVVGEAIVPARSQLYIGGSDTGYDPTEDVKSRGSLNGPITEWDLTLNDTSWLYSLSPLPNPTSSVLFLQSVNTPVNIDFVYYNGSHNLVWYTGNSPVKTDRDIWVHRSRTLNNESLCLVMLYVLTKYTKWLNGRNKNTYVNMCAFDLFINKKVQ